MLIILGQEKNNAFSYISLLHFSMKEFVSAMSKSGFDKGGGCRDDTVD